MAGSCKSVVKLRFSYSAGNFLAILANTRFSKKTYIKLQAILLLAFRRPRGAKVED